MAHMTIRSTYALDNDTDQRIKYLAKTWNVSRAEVIRRSVRAAAETSRQRLSPADVVARYAQKSLPRDLDATRRLVETLRQWRHDDDERRSGGRT